MSDMINTSVFIDLKIKIQYYKPTKEIIYFLYDTDNNFVVGGYKTLKEAFEELQMYCVELYG